MKEVLINFWAQLKDSAEASLKIELPIKFKPSNIIVCGMGGSAVGGDLLQSLVQDEVDVPIFVHRDYGVPNSLKANSLVFISTYSGNTEETLSAYEEVKKRTKNIVCITSGGKLESANPRYILKVPSGYQPRCALGWLFVPSLVILHRLEITPDPSQALEESISLLSHLSGEFSSPQSEPYKLAERLLGKFPIIYSDSRWSPVARRWVAQVNENAKQFAHFAVFPELNHNELVGFGEPKIPSFLVILRDHGYSSRINLRIDLTKELLAPYTEIEEIGSQGESLLTRFFSLIYFGDWASYWLAILKGVDPTPVDRIEWLKRKLKIKNIPSLLFNI